MDNSCNDEEYVSNHRNAGQPPARRALDTQQKGRKTNTHPDDAIVTSNETYKSRKSLGRVSLGTRIRNPPPPDIFEKHNRTHEKMSRKFPSDEVCDQIMLIRMRQNVCKVGMNPEGLK